MTERDKKYIKTKCDWLTVTSKEQEGGGKTLINIPHFHFCVSIFLLDFLFVLRFLTQQQNYTEIIISQKIIQCQKFQNLFWIMVQIPKWVRYPKEKIIQCQKLRILQWLAIVFPIKSREKDKGVSPNDWNRYELWKEKGKKLVQF